MGHLTALALQLQAAQPVSPAALAPSVWEHMSAALRDSVYRVLSLLISLLPGVLALVLAIGVLTAIGGLVSYLVRRILTSLQFDERIARSRPTEISSSIQDWVPSHSPTVLVARTVFWLHVLLGFVIGISAFDASYSTASQMSVFLLPYLAHSVGAIILLLVGNIIARFLSRSVLIGAVNAKLTYARFLSLGVKWLVLVLTAAMVLDHLGVGGAIVELAFGILFGGIVLTLALAVGLGSREIVSRSLERTADRMPPRGPFATPEQPVKPEPVAKPTGTLRHF
ncbi:MAG TPA: hypothetical protein VNW54_08920 [Granulicella sp.]|nr:hypothetical protein [Granulicella sp.]